MIYYTTEKTKRGGINMSEDLREKLFDKKENGWKKVNDEEKKNI